MIRKRKIASNAAASIKLTRNVRLVRNLVKLIVVFFLTKIPNKNNGKNKKFGVCINTKR
jgi:hypothetical protein